jgi:hypothetical protein
MPPTRAAFENRLYLRLATFCFLALAATTARAQLTPGDIDALHKALGSRIEAVTILGGDYGLTGTSLKVSRADNLTLQKFGGGGEIGPPKPLGDTFVKWQPRVQGQMGWLQAKTQNLPAPINDAANDTRSYGIQFGLGGRFWFTEHFNLAPTISGLYGHTASSFYTNGNATAASIVPQARALGLIDWQADTWTVRPATDIQWEYTFHRVIYTFTSNPVFFHTESFWTSNPNVSVNGNSGTWSNKFDVDIPLGKKLWGHELRTGGFFARTELLGDLKDGLGGTDHIYEVHPRLVLDWLNQGIPFVKWIGLGASYLWGPTFKGESFGLDVSIVF